MNLSGSDTSCQTKIDLLKEQWYLETQIPISRFNFTDDGFWREYRKQLELADKIIYYDSSHTTKIGDNQDE